VAYEVFPEFVKQYLKIIIFCLNLKYAVMFCKKYLIIVILKIFPGGKYGKFQV